MDIQKWKNEALILKLAEKNGPDISKISKNLHKYNNKLYLGKSMKKGIMGVDVISLFLQ